MTVVMVMVTVVVMMMVEGGDNDKHNNSDGDTMTEPWLTLNPSKSEIVLTYSPLANHKAYYFY